MRRMTGFGQTILRALALALGLALLLGGAPAETETDKEVKHMHMTIDNTPVQVEWEENGSVEALKALAAEGLTIQMSMYGGFEQVGSLGKSLPRSDVQTVTAPGDIVLYSGSSIVVFYGSNSWAYTRLGRIVDPANDELEALLGRGDVTLTLSMN